MTITIVPDNRPDTNSPRLYSGFSHPTTPHGPRVGSHQVYATTPAPSRMVRHGWPCRCTWGKPAPALPDESQCNDFFDVLTVTFVCDCGYTATERVYTADVRRIRKRMTCPNSVAGGQNAA